MRKSVVELGATAALLLGAALSWGQQPATPAPVEDAPKDQPAKSKLEEMIEKALHDNPDLRLAEAKLAEAEAELNKARLLVVQKVAAQYQAVEAQKAAVDGAAAELEETKTAYKAASVSQAVVRTAEQKLIDAKAKLASLEAELPYLLGQQAERKIDAKIRFWYEKLDVSQPPKNADAEYLRRWYLDVTGRLPTAEEVAAALPKPTVQGPTADRIRAALDKPFSFECKDQTMSYLLQRMSNEFQDANPDLLIKNNIPFSNNDSKVSVHFDKVPFGAALEWIEDSSPKYRVAVRDYGLVIAPKEDLPPGAPLLHDFWRGAKDQSPASPAKVIEGQVIDVAKDGRIQVNVGQKDGLAIGDILAVIRQESEAGRAELVGRVRVVVVATGDALTEPAEPWSNPAKWGDKVRKIDK